MLAAQISALFNTMAVWFLATLQNHDFTTEKPSEVYGLLGSGYQD